MIEQIEGSDRRLYGNVFMWTTLFYAGLACLSAMWYLIWSGHWWPTYFIGLIGWFFIHISWWDLLKGHFYTRDFLYPVDEKRIFENGVFMRRGEQAYMLLKRKWSWDPDTETMEKLPIRVWYNAFGKAVDRKVNIHISQVSQVR